MLSSAITLFAASSSLSQAGLEYIHIIPFQLARPCVCVCMSHVSALLPVLHAHLRPCCTFLCVRCVFVDQGELPLFTMHKMIKQHTYETNSSRVPTRYEVLG